MIFITPIKKTWLLKLGQIFDKLAKLGKSTQDAYNQEGWLILQDLLNEWVAEGVASDVNDFSNYPTHLSISSDQRGAYGIMIKSKALIKP